MTTAAISAKGAWAIDASHSEISFKVKHLVVTTMTGKFDTFEGSVEAENNDFNDAKIKFSADVNSINTGNEQRDGHLKSDDFFTLPLPRTIGPELFNVDYIRNAQQTSKTESLSIHDVLATLTRFSAETISELIKNTIGQRKFEIYVSGGGAHNPLLIKSIKELLNIGELRSTSTLGISGDAKEAILFAILANETLAGKPVNFGRRAKIPSVNFGKISFPT